MERRAESSLSQPSGPYGASMDWDSVTLSSSMQDVDPPCETLPPVDIDPEGSVRIILDIIHSRFDKVPETLHLRDLYRLTVLTHKYDLAHLLRPWATAWVEGARRKLESRPQGRSSLLSAGIPSRLLPRSQETLPFTVTLERLIFIAWHLGDIELYKSLALTLARHCPVDSNGELLQYKGGSDVPLFSNTKEPPGLLGELILLRQILIQTSLDCYHDANERLNDTAYYVVMRDAPFGSMFPYGAPYGAADASQARLEARMLLQMTREYLTNTPIRLYPEPRLKQIKADFESIWSILYHAPVFNADFLFNAPSFSDLRERMDRIWDINGSVTPEQRSRMEKSAQRSGICPQDHQRRSEKPLISLESTVKMQGDLAIREPVHSIQPLDEWRVEQGIAGVEYYLLDQTKGPGEQPVIPTAGQATTPPPDPKHDDDLAKDEIPGWSGYVEWEDYPKKKQAAHEILISHEFPPPPEFQLEPIPGTNPVLEGVRWKQWHRAVGGRLKNVPEESWAIVVEEKDPNMLHLLQFPYNGEPPKRLVTAHEVTPNPLHFIRNHGGIPIIDPESWFLRLDGLVREPKKLTLADLQDETRFPRMERMVTIQCSGTRRIEQIALYAGEGDEMINAPWAEGAIGTARYVGISLKKVIKYCGGLVDGAKHLELVGADTVS
ncbi:hypothetical protein NPX13_g10025 [Xylaria arbuscula]|uniref:Oxidoreductase molybdopterin-binding domain-containing protein n=1 Tax=Xylaria arbuscula TaxID=114810 RepID=A0A9W8TH64_9PEZI|nr:hypothetical protein NPX13_g10025 [Xylaria arbuscula]